MKNFLIAALISILSVGCATKNIEFPAAKMYPYSTQKKMQAAEHWKILAENEAMLISEKLPPGSVVNIECTAPICGGHDNLNSTFARAYRDLLISALSSRGILIAIEKETNAYNLTYNVHVISHKDREKIGDRRTGLWTGTAAAAYLIYQATTHWTHNGLAVLPFAIGADIVEYHEELTSETDSEIVVTTKVIHGNQILTADSRTYYINSGDATHYLDCTNGKCNFKTDPDKDGSCIVKKKKCSSIKVVGDCTSGRCES